MIILKNRLEDMFVKPVIITIISAGDIGEAMHKINNFSYPGVSSFRS